MIAVFDTSALIALMWKEVGWERLVAQLNGGAISTVNVAELVTFGVRNNIPAAAVAEGLQAMKLEQHPFDEKLAVATGALWTATRQHGLSLGDRACLALTKQLGGRAITSDRAWAALDLGIPIELFR